MAERLIDAEAFLDFLCIEEKIMEGEEITFDYVRSLIVSAPTIKAKPVVHCKDCKYSRMYCFGDCEEPVLACCDIDDDGTIYCAESVNEYDYCSKGEKRDAQMDEIASDTNVGSKGVKIPVMSMKDICRKIMCDR